MLLTAMQQVEAKPITCKASSAKNLLVEAKGVVLLKRKGSMDYSPTAIGEELYPGDLIKLEEGAEATVCCANSTAWSVPKRVPSGLTNGCPPQLPPNDNNKPFPLPFFAPPGLAPPGTILPTLII
ncbi:MAG: hypothetical protein ACRDEA_05260, partial [Microcystaceae cyanobacterium]